jgi:hypothetical protein
VQIWVKMTLLGGLKTPYETDYAVMGHSLSA